MAAPSPKGAPDKEALPHVACKGGWCVNFNDSQVTHDGKAASGRECFKNDLCASIVAQRHVLKATTDGIATFGNFKLLANGVILDSESVKVLANCNDKGSVDHKCVANFLRKTVASVNSENKKGAVSQKESKPAAKFNKPATAGSNERKLKTERTERPFSSPFFDQDKSEQQMVEDAWDDAKNRIPGGL